CKCCPSPSPTVGAVYDRAYRIGMDYDTDCAETHHGSVPATHQLRISPCRQATERREWPVDCRPDVSQQDDHVPGRTTAYGRSPAGTDSANAFSRHSGKYRRCDRGWRNSRL